MYTPQNVCPTLEVEGLENYESLTLVSETYTLVPLICGVLVTVGLHAFPHWYPASFVRASLAMTIAPNSRVLKVFHLFTEGIQGECEAVLLSFIIYISLLMELKITLVHFSPGKLLKPRFWGHAWICGS